MNYIRQMLYTITPHVDSNKATCISWWAVGSGQWFMCTSSNIAKTLFVEEEEQEKDSPQDKKKEVKCKVHTYSTKTATAGFDVVFSLEIQVWILHHVRELEQAFQCVLCYSGTSLIRTKIIVLISGASSFQGENNINTKLGFGQVSLLQRCPLREYSEFPNSFEDFEQFCYRSEEITFADDGGGSTRACFTVCDQITQTVHSSAIWSMKVKGTHESDLHSCNIKDSHFLLWERGPRTRLGYE